MRRPGPSINRQPLLLALIMGLILVLFGAWFWPAYLRADGDERQFTATDDAYVNIDRPDETFHAKELLVASEHCNADRLCRNQRYKTYLRFDVKGLDGNRRIATVRLKLFATRRALDGGQVYAAVNNSWQGETITWHNAPATQPQPIGSIGPVLSTGWHEVQLPPRSVSGDGTVTLVLASRDENTAGYKGAKNLRQKPSLIVGYDNLTNVTKSDETVTVAAMGDISCDQNHFSPDDCQDTSPLIDGIKPAAILLLGDIQYDVGSLKDFQKYFDPHWSKYRGILKPAPGNHEYRNSTKYNHISFDTRKPDGCSVTTATEKAFACGYFDYFNGVGNNDGPAGQRDKGYYAFSMGNWRIYSANSNCRDGEECSAGSAQERWLRDDLARYPGQCKLMYMHHPFSSSDIRNFDAYMQGLPDQPLYLIYKTNMDEVRDLIKAFYDYGGDLVLAGHSHMYERFGKQNPERRADPSGFREFVVGTGGRYSYDPDLAALRPLSEVTSRAGDKGVLKLSLAPDRYSWQFVANPGTALQDHGSDRCNSAP